MSYVLQDAGRWWEPQAERRHVEKEVSAQRRPAYIALVIFTGILLLAPQNFFPILAKFRIATLAGGGAIVCLLYDWWLRRKPILITREIVVCFLIIAWAVLTLPLSFWPAGSIGVLTDLYIKSVTIFFLLPNIVTTPARLRSIALTLVICAIPIALISLKNYVTGNFIIGSDPSFERVLGYQSGLASNPNDMALMLNLILPLAIALFLQKPRPGLAFLCFVAVILDAAGVIVSMSRAGFIGLAITAILYFTRLVRRPGRDRKLAMTVLALAILAVPLLPSNYVERIATIADRNADPTGSAQARWQGNIAAIRFIQQRPVFGAGLGMGMIALNMTGGPLWHDVHNVYLQYAVDLGIPGLVLFVLLMFGVISAVRSARNSSAELPALRNVFLLDEAIQISLVVFAATSFFYFYYMVGLALAARVATANALAEAKEA
jgi:O-antigen ligase